MAFVYKLINPPTTPDNNKNVKWIRTLKPYLRSNFFLWMCYHNKIPSAFYLNTLKIMPSNNYQIVTLQQKPPNTSSLDAALPQNFWNQLNISFPPSNHHNVDWLLYLKNLNHHNVDWLIAMFKPKVRESIRTICVHFCFLVFAGNPAFLYKKQKNSKNGR